MSAERDRLIPKELRVQGPPKKEEKVLVEKKPEVVLPKIDQLCAVVKIGKSRQLFFIGWDLSREPMLTQEQKSLSEDALTSFKSYIRTRLSIREIPYEKVDLATFSYVGRPINYENGAEDLLVLGIKKPEAGSEEIILGELGLLEAIINSSQCWQDLGKGYVSEDSSRSIKYHTLFFANPEIENTGIALLFEPVSRESSNEITYSRFLQEILMKLLMMNNERYQEIIKHYVREPENKGLIDKLSPLFTPEGMEDLKRKVKGVSDFLTKIGILEEEVGEMLIKPDQVLDLENFTLSELFELASEMLSVARRYYIFKAKPH